MGKRWNIILPIVVISIVAIVLIIKRDDLGTFVDTIRGVELIPFIIAAFCLFGRYFSHAFAYKAVFRCVDEDVKYLHIVPLTFSVTFANDCAPTAGTAGSVLIAAWSHKQGLNMGKSVTVVFLEKVGFYGGFSIVMLIGFSILIFTGQMVWYLALGGLAVLLMIFSFGFVMWLGYGHVDAELKLFSWIERLVNRALVMFKRKPMDPWSERIAASFHEAACIAAEKPKQIVIMICRMFLLHACDCTCFICVGFAFGFTYIPFLMASYVAGFIIATFILQTIGAVEILLALILTAYGASPVEAAAISVVYRGLIFWIPFLIGAICINITGAQKQVFAEDSGEVLAAGGDEVAARVEFTEEIEEPVYEDVSEMMPVPPVAWVEEQNKSGGHAKPVDLADIVQGFAQTVVKGNDADSEGSAKAEDASDDDQNTAGAPEPVKSDQDISESNTAAQERYPIPPKAISDDIANTDAAVQETDARAQDAKEGE